MKGLAPLSKTADLLIDLLADPCQTKGCDAPYNEGCRVVNDEAECICPTCPETINPVCSSDDVQDPSECAMRRQACLTSNRIAVNRRAPCGMLKFIIILFKLNINF